MPISDFLYVLSWWAILLSIGAIFFPTTALLFKRFFDKGYIFAKILGLAVTSYVALVLGVAHLVVFSQGELFVILVACALFQFIMLSKRKNTQKRPLHQILFSPTMAVVLVEELFFFSGLLFWAYVRAHQPDIHGLEKYMDFGFVNSILRSDYFPPKDMWYTPLPINYYYFGHLATAVLTKLSGIPSKITFNLMLATLFGFTFAAGFSLVGNFWTQFLHAINPGKRLLVSFISSGIVGGFILSCCGNLHTLYTFFTPYQNEFPVPLWRLKFSPKTFPNVYWYPNATRFIYHTIHEFPIYSFVVSDLHGHVVDIPFVLLTIGLFFSLFLYEKEEIVQKLEKSAPVWQRFLQSIPFFPFLILISFLLAVMYMTNALDGLIYMLLACICIFALYKGVYEKKFYQVFYQTPLFTAMIVILGGFVIFSLPFSLFFKSFVNQIGVVCAPPFLLKLQTIGPFIFEQNHCNTSPWWQLATLYGFFVFWAVCLCVVVIKTKRTIADIFMLVLVGFALLLIILPEFFYLKDIYTTYYRANTMFKLVYQSFMMLSLVSSYAIARTITTYVRIKNILKSLLVMPVIIIGLISLVLVSIYPYFAITSYYGNLRTYYGLDGTTYLATLYPDDYSAILWINAHISGQPNMLEAQGDSYTDYERISTNTGLPTVLGWTVHEWLWRGTYSVVPPRMSDVETMYDTTNITLTKQLLTRYHINYVYVGDLERKKYPNLSENKFRTLGQIVFHQGQTTIYQLSF